MKPVIYIVVLFLASSLAVTAQKPLTMTDDSVKFGNTRCPGIWVEIPESNIESVRKNWIKTLEKSTKSNALVTGNEITIFGALIKDISEAPVNIFSEINSQDSLVRLFAALELKRDEFTTVNTKEHEQLKKVVKQFAKDQYMEVAGDQLKDEESKLKDLEKDLASLRKDKEKMEKAIQSANTSISQENYKIVTVNKEMAVTEASLDSKSTDLSTMTDADSKKTVQSEIKDLQKKKKEHLKDISTSENRISKANTEILDSNNGISMNIIQQEELGLKINAQKRVVKKYADKLKTIESY